MFDARTFTAPPGPLLPFALITDPAVVVTLCVASSVMAPPAPAGDEAPGNGAVVATAVELIVSTAIVFAPESGGPRASGGARAITLIVEVAPELFALVVAMPIARFNARVSPAYTDMTKGPDGRIAGALKAGPTPVAIDAAGVAICGCTELGTPIDGPTNGNGTACPAAL